jgi:uncharacterized protein YpuA (DUF1002 family)
MDRQALLLKLCRELTEEVEGLYDELEVVLSHITAAVARADRNLQEDVLWAVEDAYRELQEDVLWAIEEAYRKLEQRRLKWERLSGKIREIEREIWTREVYEEAKKFMEGKL